MRTQASLERPAPSTSGSWENSTALASASRSASLPIARLTLPMQVFLTSPSKTSWRCRVLATASGVWAEVCRALL
ncbi:unnamed protein product [Symbiodinium necroappetens]|uniref:Uncharacterized protein n=1 Tax=Symbiodinium necroappetens TaxID=1628268 RepID=A0A812XR03_9DINO|nr:unnamed protein product [Symbiodinium necroappetens]